MKKIAFYLISLLACVGLTSSCSSDDDETNFSDGTELAIGGEEINSITKITGYLPVVYGYSDTCIVKCFHCEEEVMACHELTDYRGNVDITIPPIDWNSQTLVLAEHQHRCVIEYKDCKIIKKGERYLVELYYRVIPANAIGRAGAFIVINEPNLTEKRLSMKAVEIPPTSPAYN